MQSHAESCRLLWAILTLNVQMSVFLKGEQVNLIWCKQFSIRALSLPSNIVVLGWISDPCRWRRCWSWAVLLIISRWSKHMRGEFQKTFFFSFLIQPIPIHSKAKQFFLTGVGSIFNCWVSIGFRNASFTYDKVSANTATSFSKSYEKSDESQDARRGSPGIPNEPSDY